MPLPELPVQLGKAGRPSRSADTPTDYWNLVADGYTADAAEENLSPQEKAARTRAANKAKEDQATSQDGPDTTDAGTNQT